MFERNVIKAYRKVSGLNQVTGSRYGVVSAPQKPVISETDIISRLILNGYHNNPTSTARRSASNKYCRPSKTRPSTLPQHDIHQHLYTRRRHRQPRSQTCRTCRQGNHPWRPPLRYRYSGQRHRHPPPTVTGRSKYRAKWFDRRQVDTNEAFPPRRPDRPT